MKKINVYYKILIIFILFGLLIYFIPNNFFIGFLNIDSFFNSDKCYEEKANLTDNLYISKIKALEDEIDLLKSSLDIKSTYSDYDLVFVKKIYNNKMYFQNNIIINKGKNSDIKIGDAVVNSKGLVGKVIKTSYNSSVVKLINASDIKDFSVVINNEIATVTKYDGKYLKIDFQDNRKSVKENDIVYTSGLGSFPKGIVVGKVMEKKKNDIGYTLTVDINEDINKISYLGVLIKK